MTTTNAKTDAERLAEVLRVVQPANKFISLSRDPIGVWIGNDTLKPDSLTDIARVLAMLDGEQRDRFVKRCIKGPFNSADDPGVRAAIAEPDYWLPMNAYEALTAPPSTLIAALWAAVVKQ